MRGRGFARLSLLVLAMVAGACAARTPAPLPAVSAPKFPEFMQPPIPRSLAGYPAAVTSQQRGWQFLQAGDFKNAEREFKLALSITPQFHPAETALGYLELARKQPSDALPHFERALAGDPREVSALVGGGLAFLALNRESDALFAFESATAVDPGLTDIKRRVEVLRFRGLGQDLAAARQAAADGKLDEAARAYASAIASSPDSPFLYRELAGVERRQGNADAALADFRKAMALDPTDASSGVGVGDLLAERGDLEGAEKAYSDSLLLEPSDAVDAKLEAVRARIELARLPPEYRAIDTAAQITRGDLAALIGVRLAPLVQSGRRRDAVVVTDARNHWANTWIMAVVRAGIIEPYDNHTFQPRAVVRRTDLALAMSRLLQRVAAANPAQGRGWESARLKFADLSTGHLAYPAASMAVAAGVMKTGADNAFQPASPVSGAEAVAAISRVEQLAGPQPAGGGATPAAQGPSQNGPGASATGVARP
jgi:tetratricopeptide (TPR) repeat protein